MREKREERSATTRDKRGGRRYKRHVGRRQRRENKTGNR